MRRLIPLMVFVAALPVAAAEFAVSPPSLPPGFPAQPRSTAPITMVFPGENASLPHVTSHFVLGAIADHRSTFTINGQTVTAYSNGGYLAWLPVQPGTFTFNCELIGKSSTSVFQRTIFIAPAPAPLADEKPAIEAASLWPLVDHELKPGDVVTARMKATRGQKAFFKLGDSGWQPMAETNPSLGLYEGGLIVSHEDRLDAATVEYKIGSGFKSAKARSAGKIWANNLPPAVAVVKGVGPVSLRAAPRENIVLHLQGGAKVLINGRSGAHNRVLLAGGLHGWIESKDLEIMPTGTLPPRASIETISLRAGGDDSTVVRVNMSDRVPFSIEPDDDGRALSVRLHYAAANTDWIIYAAPDDFVEEVRFKQEATGLVLIRILLSPAATLWGYHGQFESGGLRIELRRPPRLVPSPSSALTGIKVFLDPGHGPSQPGETGPLGTRELDVNWAIAKEMERLLLKEGALAFLSRNAPFDEVALGDRPRLAWENRADLFVSIHNNYLGLAANPFASPRGFSTFYFTPHSLPLAKAVHAAYQKNIPLYDERLRLGNYLVLRPTQMPAILTETAYLTYPEQEAKLLDPKFRALTARTMVEGLRRFLEDERVKQAKRRASGR
ncbi:MAG: N-acetylmuramoyl-L-alanine amidase [Elusimicrobia bacterium]|nr:N-acetylmuramoyl-L-alanine amidase [Elusimicrobiota bacterium]